MSAVCPACERPQDQGLLCHACVTVLERELAEVRALMEELDTSLSKQARLGTPGKSGLARERMPMNVGAVDPRWVIDNVLGTWARDVSGETWQPRQSEVHVYRNRDSRQAGPFCLDCRHRSCAAMRVRVCRPALPVSAQAAAFFLREIPAIRRHPAAAELFDEITDAIRQARRAVDRPADRTYLGQCLMENLDEEGRQVTCLAELYARAGASEVRCTVCGTEHPVVERRAWLLKRAEDMLFTVREAAQMMGDVGGIKVTEAAIRGYIHRQRIAYRPGGRTIRLGDLLAVVLDESERKSA